MEQGFTKAECMAKMQNPQFNAICEGEKPFSILFLFLTKSNNFLNSVHNTKENNYQLEMRNLLHEIIGKWYQSRDTQH